ncbi:alpha/beta hydrolase [Acaryochloris thomasi]|nr:alpha/beta hydrolase [Acaryochloris thomasi]
MGRVRRLAPRWMLMGSMGVAIAYILFCLYLFQQQRTIVFDPNRPITTLPNDPTFKLPYEDITIPVGDQQQMQGWWIPAPTADEAIEAIPNEPTRILSSPMVVLMLKGRGGNRSSRSHLARTKGLRQLGFAVLLVDYRGYGDSDGDLPSEANLYQDSQAAWHYLTQVRRILPEQIVIHGESMGGAVAIDLATQQPQAAGLIVQSSFTSMSAAIKQFEWLNLLPIDLLLTQRFDSIAKVRSLQMPVLYLHGTADQIVPAFMSEQLYKATPTQTPKELLLVPDRTHYRIYRPGQTSYLRAVQRLANKIEAR